jgi:phosphotransferase system HPr-like phosphotransfer protein
LTRKLIDVDPDIWKFIRGLALWRGEKINTTVQKAFLCYLALAVKQNSEIELIIRSNGKDLKEFIEKLRKEFVNER